MDLAYLNKRTLSEIVSENYVFASILYYFGIHFFEYSNKTLEEVCKKNRIDINRVVQELGRTIENSSELPAISKYPIDLLIEYLKHSHHIFAKKKLPYLACMIQALKVENPKYHQQQEDLKLLFPLFVEDFIHHIYFEEDTFFNYVLKLYRAENDRYSFGKLFFLLEKNSVADFASEHEAHDDVMEGIRKITNGYLTNDDTPLHLKVIYSELLSFEKELTSHAYIENNILFPKALVIENKLKQVFEKSSRLN
ncbi:MAG: hemerythrin domain-containing protein [Cyclobacteriaceae bacterium]|nr:hemerythrin domain-containing protein [Cyclobacteriaceae bacterium]